MDTTTVINWLKLATSNFRHEFEGLHCALDGIVGVDGYRVHYWRSLDPVDKDLFFSENSEIPEKVAQLINKWEDDTIYRAWLGGVYEIGGNACVKITSEESNAFINFAYYRDAVLLSPAPGLIRVGMASGGIVRFSNGFSIAAYIKPLSLHRDDVEESYMKMSAKELARSIAINSLIQQADDAEEEIDEIIISAVGDLLRDQDRFKGEEILSGNVLDQWERARDQKEKCYKAIRNLELEG